MITDYTTMAATHTIGLTTITRDTIITAWAPTNTILDTILDTTITTTMALTITPVTAHTTDMDTTIRTTHMLELAIVVTIVTTITTMVTIKAIESLGCRTLHNTRNNTIPAEDTSINNFGRTQSDK